MKTKRIPIKGRLKALFLVLLSGLLLPIVVLFVMTILISRQGESRANLGRHNPSILVRDRYDYYLDEIENDKRLFGFWEIPGKIPRVVEIAILAAEDRRFYEHDGVDHKAVMRAVRQNIKAREVVSGASTIAMQIVRMEHPAARNFWNKAVEAFAARRLIQKYGHEKVLRHYLKIAPFGNRYHGIAYASEKYFHKPLRDINLAEACLLLSIPQQPNAMNLYDLRGRTLAVRRAGKILDDLMAYEMITEKEFSDAKVELSQMPLFEKEERPHYAMHYILKLREHIKERKNIFHASLDLKLQEKMGSYLKSYVNTRRNKGVGNSAFILTDSKSGEILVYLGSAGYYSPESKGSIDYCQTPRSSGSILKPFIYALGMMERGYNSATILSDTALYLPSEERIFTPQNADRSFDGPVLYRFALANSRNIPAVQLVNEIGLQTTFDFFKKLDLLSSEKNADYFGLSVAIGGLYVRLYDMMRAYGMLANDGREYSLVWQKVEDKSSKESSLPTQIIPADIARMLSLYLSDPAARTPTFKRKGSLEFPFPVAIKTGTSQGFRDAWTLAYTDRYVLGAWTGDADNGKMHYQGGSISSVYILRHAMQFIHEHEMKGLGNIGFNPPEGYISRDICKISGKLATPHTAAYVTEWFKPGTEPREYSDLFRKIIIDSRTGNYANKNTPQNFQQAKVVAFLDQKYSEWAQLNGITLAPARTVLGQEKAQDLDNFNISITEPADGLKFLINPSQPKEYQTIALKARVEPALEQVVWYHNGRPLEIVSHPYVVRWPLESGRHEFQVKSANAPVSSEIVQITVE